MSFNDSEGNTLTKYGNYLCVWEKQEDGSWKCVMESPFPVRGKVGRNIDLIKRFKINVHDAVVKTLG
jgi:hypothetical protein